MRKISTKVLLIEPEATIREMVADLLGRAGYEVEQVGDYADGVATAERTMTNIIVIGMRPRGRRSSQLLADLRRSAQTAAIPVILCTTLGRLLGESAELTNVRGCLLLPLEFSRVEEMVAQVLGNPPSSTPQS